MNMTAVLKDSFDGMKKNWMHTCVPQPQMAQAFLNAHPGENKLLIYPTDHTFIVKTNGTFYMDRAIEESISPLES